MKKLLIFTLTAFCIACISGCSENPSEVQTSNPVSNPGESSEVDSNTEDDSADVSDKNTSGKVTAVPPPEVDCNGPLDQPGRPTSDYTVEFDENGNLVLIPK